MILDAIRERLFLPRTQHATVERRIQSALEARLEGRRGRSRSATARIVFQAHGIGAWTVDLSGSTATLSRGGAARATSTIASDPDTLLDVLEGRVAGVSAFLDGSLHLRGNIAQSLEIDDLLPPRSRHSETPECKRITAGGLATFYLEAGPKDAPAVVFFHGLGATCASLLPTFMALAREYHVYSVDLPGFGESDKPLRPLHAAYHAQWAVAFLDAVGIERAHLIGNSMGGRLALEVGLRSPQRVDRLVLLAPSLAWRRFRAGTRLVRLLRPELAALPLPVLHRFVVHSLRSMFARPDRISRGAANAAADEFVRVFATPRGRIAFFHAAREIYLEQPHGLKGFWSRLPTLEAPALFIFGDRDWLVPPGFVRYVRQALPSARCEVFEDCGHIPQFEHPDRTNERVRGFLTEKR